MERGDIATYVAPERACLFEGLIAEPPTKLHRLLNLVDKDATDDLKRWKANEMPLKSLIDSTNRLGIHTQVFTLLGPFMEEPIYHWLLRKGVSCSVYGYTNINDALDDFKYNRGLNTIYVPTTELAHTIGIRAKVVSPSTSWSN